MFWYGFLNAPDCIGGEGGREGIFFFFFGIIEVIQSHAFSHIFTWFHTFSLGFTHFHMVSRCEKVCTKVKKKLLHAL